MEILSDGKISISVSRHGAEMQHLICKGREYLWQGDSAYWGRRSPVLFPIVGSLWNKEMRINGHLYEMGQHGFARDLDFELMEQTPDQLRYRLTSDEETRKKFPYDFILEISYVLENNSVRVIWEVTNSGDKAMDFQIGAHPGFYYPDFQPDSEDNGYFTLEKEGQLLDKVHYLLIGEKGCADVAGLHSLSLQDHQLRLDLHTFDQDAFILEDNQVDKVTLYGKDGEPWLSVRFDAPLVGLWSPPSKNAPFVCIEPWYGRCDRVGYEGEFAGRDHINHLEPGATFHGAYSIEIEG